MTYLCRMSIIMNKHLDVQSQFNPDNFKDVSAFETAIATAKQCLTLIL